MKKFHFSAVIFSSMETQSEKQLYAVDLVLLPNEQISTQALALHESLVSTIPNGIHFNYGKLPHISVWMGLVDDEGIAHLKKFISNEPDTQIILNELISIDRKTSFLSHWNLTLENEVAIKSKYMASSRIWEKAFDIEPRREHFAEDTNQNSMSYVRNYNLESSRLHITIGHGKLNQKELPMQGTASWALFQLGDFCSCGEEARLA
ncbi:MAG: hypothetical protein P8H98_07165 [Flavobacteriales bacterium]|nr:hypothetical protein [Flavobacteriales bacterium]